MDGLRMSAAQDRRRRGLPPRATDGPAEGRRERKAEHGSRAKRLGKSEVYAAAFLFFIFGRQEQKLEAKVREDAQKRRCFLPNSSPGSQQIGSIGENNRMYRLIAGRIWKTRAIGFVLPLYFFSPSTSCFGINRTPPSIHHSAQSQTQLNHGCSLHLAQLQLLPTKRIPIALGTRKLDFAMLAASDQSG